MALDLWNAPPADFPIPEGLHITLDDVSDWDVDGLPYYNRADAARFQTLARQKPRLTYHFAARRNGRLVGHSLLYLSPGPLGIAGLYSVGVLLDARNQGIGRAVSLAACQYARALGCRYVLLNAATPIYERLGFVSLGYGQTWFMFPPVLNAAPPSPETVAFVEVLGRGDTAALDALPPQARPADLDARLPCKMTPLEVAARLEQPRSAQWLLNTGATPDVIAFCDLGWRDRLPELLAARPELANRRGGEWGQTPLHEAIARNDGELVRLLLSAQPDLTIEDSHFHATALGWARHFRRKEIIRLIEAQS
jgi:GNAT superfamily N-acetyltransferase